ncbi:hypothetical protein DFQ30_000813 [Apophysomyces sp. BC1015]|nr:hypothetical protein DFQ30_000813 [Apophysomyces sp. BC1015]
MIDLTKNLFVPLPDANEDANTLPRRMRVNIKRLREIFPNANGVLAADGLQFNLTDDVQVWLSTVRFRPGSQPGTWAWYGRLAGSQSIYGHLAITGLDGEDAKVMVSASVHVEDRAYAIESAGFNGEVSCSVMGKLSPAQCAVETGLTHRSVGPGALADLAPASARAQAGVAAPVSIHLLAVYGPELAQRYPGGSAALTARIGHWVEVANTTLANSGVQAVLSFEIEQASLLTERGVRSLLRNQVGKTIGTGHPYQPSGAAALEVSAMRDRHKSDLVVGLAESSERDSSNNIVLGIANIIQRTPREDRSTLPYAVCAVALTDPLSGHPVPDYALVHELGHLLGLSHDAMTTGGRSGEPDAQYDYARGYVPPDKSFVTTMGYDRSGLGPHIPYFSTPQRHFALMATVTPELGGYITADPLGLYPKGTSVRLRAISRAGFTFLRMRVNDETIDSPETVVTVTEDMNVIAEFDVGSSLYTLTADIQSADDPSEVGTIGIEPWQPRYLPGTDVEVSFDAASDEVAFTGWEVDGHSVWNAVSAGSRARLSWRVEQNHHIVAHVAKRDCLTDISGLPATLGTVELVPKPGLPDEFMAFFRYGAPAGQVMTFRAAAYKGAPFERWQVDAGRIQREYQEDGAHLVDVLVERAGFVMACFSHDPSLVEVVSAIDPPRPYGPAIVNVKPKDVTDASPGSWFPRGLLVTVSLYWWNEDGFQLNQCARRAFHSGG